MAVHGIWDRLSGEVQEAVGKDLAALRGTDDWLESLDGWLSQALNMRRGAVRRLEAEELASALVRLVPRIDAESLEMLLVHLHMYARSDLLLAIYGSLGVPSPSVDLTDIQMEAVLDPARAAREVPALLRDHEASRLSLCMDLMEIVTFEGWRPAAQAGAEALRRAVCAAAESADQLAAPAEAPQEADVEPDAVLTQDEPEVGSVEEALELAPQFSGLDRLMIRTIVSTANGTTGAPAIEEVDQVVHELVQLNDQRPQSWFHSGYFDALTEQPRAQHARGENRDRRAWYLAGWFLGRRRTASPAAIMAAESLLDDRDLEVLLSGAGHPAGQMLAPHVFEAALEADATPRAIAWLRPYLGSCAPLLVRIALTWSIRALRRELSGELADVLGMIWQQLPSIRAGQPGMPSDLLVTVGRRYGIALRSAGRMVEAEAVVREVIAVSGPEDRPNLLTDLALACMGVGSIAEIDLPSGEPRAGFLESIEAARELLAEAAEEPGPSAVARWVLEMPLVANRDAPPAELERGIKSLRGVVEAMVQPGAPRYWRDSGALDKVRWHLAVLELRTMEPSLAQPAVARLRGSLRAGVVPPLDLLCEAIGNAAMLDAKGVSELGRIALRTDVAPVLACLDLLAVCKRSSAFRDALLDTLNEHAADLRPVEAWEACKALALGALDGTPRDVDVASDALDYLDDLAQNHTCGDLMLNLLDSPGRLEPAWDATACQEARVRLLLGMGRRSDGRAALSILINGAITRGEHDAADLLAKLTSMGAPRSEVDPLRARLLERDGASADEELPTPDAPASQRRMRILFIGGHEVQEAYRDDVVATLRRVYPNATLDYRNPGWGSNWARLLRRLRGRLEQADAIVLMRFVRTNLGRSVRRLASEQHKPWIPCTGHGRGAIERSVLRAAEVVCELSSV